MSCKLSIIIPSFNTSKLTQKCIARARSVFRGLPYEIIVVDNASQDDTRAVLKNKFPQVCLLANRQNRGFAKAVNQGVRRAKGDYILLLNTDAFVNQKILATLNYLDARPRVGILSPRLVYPGGRLQANFGNTLSLFTELLQTTQVYKLLPWGRVIMPNALTRSRFYQIREVKWLGGTCLFIRKEVFARIGLFDERFFMYLEDLDFCQRARKAGFQVIFWGKGQIVHQHHASARNTLQPWLYERASLKHFWRKHYPKRKMSLQLLMGLNALKLQAKTWKIKFKEKNNRQDFRGNDKKIILGQ